MPSGKLVTLLAAVAVLVTACAGGETPTTPVTSPAPDNVVRVLNLNAAMGFKMGAGDSGGTDATEEDLAFLAGDIVGQNADVAHLQEMARPAAERLAKILREKTGDEWQLNWSTSLEKATYYPGKDENEEPSPGYHDVPAGNAQLIRIGDGITAQKPITVDDQLDDQGIRLPSGARSIVGAELTTSVGAVDVYNTHLALERDAEDEVRAADVAFIQERTEARTNPAVLTGDFNQTIDFVPGQPYPNHHTVDAIRAFMAEYGYVDVAKDQGPTSNEKRKALGTRRIDFILARGVATKDTVKFVSHESDHWGLVTTLDGGAPPEDRPASPSTSPTTTTATTTTAAPPVGPTVEGAIARYEDFLHAVGAEDVATVCEIAGPAAKKAEDQGFGPCEQTIPMMFGMISPAQKQALTTATVDPAQVTGGGTAVSIPAAAIQAVVPFTSSDIGDAELAFQGGQWFMVD